MALTFDWANLVVESSASITDLPAFHVALREAEDDAIGMVFPVIHKWKALDLGGAFFYQADFINGWQLKFPTPGNYAISGNLNAAIVSVAGVYVERKTSAAYVTTAIGGSGPTAADIAAQVRIELAAELAQLTKVSKIHGIGVPLVVTPTSRTAGDVVQTITTVSDTTTVSAA